MFEFDKFERRRMGAPASPGRPYRPFPGADRRAFLLWGEHCIECAAPDCFASCDLYQARPDRRCRRLEYGMFRNRRFPSAAGYGAEVVFRQWGKLEARGNALLMAPGLVRFLERGVALTAPLANLLGALVGRATGDIRWSYLTFSLLERLNSRLQRRSRGGALPDAFIVEIYNPGDSAVSLLLSMAIDRTKVEGGTSPAQLPRPVLRKLVIPPGYFREDLPAELFAALVGSGHPFNLALTPEAPEGTHLVFLTLDFVRHRAAMAVAAEPEASAAKPRTSAKCVVFDLDNTLWKGILLEGEVELREGVKDLLRRLDERGILVSAASKNAPEDAMVQLRAFGLDDYLLHPSIGWGAKSEGVREIAARLDIGLDSLIFVDDSPFERDEVARALPQVEVLADTEIPRLLDHPRLAGSATPESRARRQMYREAIAREAAAVDYGSDYLAFLRDCEIRVTVRPDRPEDLARIQELVQRTNQLNFSGRKYTRPELERVLGDPGLERRVIEVEDRYGDYGTVGFCLARRVYGGIRIEDLMLSCRVQGKFIEQALLHHLCARAAAQPRFVEIRFRATDRNAAARATLDQLGFAETESGSHRANVPPGLFAPDFLAVDG